MELLNTFIYGMTARRVRVAEEEETHVKVAVSIILKIAAPELPATNAKKSPRVRARKVQQWAVANSSKIKFFVLVSPIATTGSITALRKTG